MKLIIILSIAGSLLLAACGGGSNIPLPQKNVTLTFSMMSSAHGSAILGIDAFAIIPQGATVPLVTNTNQIDPASLKGHNNSGQATFGVYSASTRKIHISVLATTASGIPFGSIADVTMPVSTGVAIGLNDFLSLNSVAVPYLNSTLYEILAVGGIPQSQVKVTLSATPGF